MPRIPDGSCAADRRSRCRWSSPCPAFQLMALLLTGTAPPAWGEERSGQSNVLHRLVGRPEMSPPSPASPSAYPDHSRAWRLVADQLDMADLSGGNGGDQQLELQLAFAEEVEALEESGCPRWTSRRICPPGAPAEPRAWGPVSAGAGSSIACRLAETFLSPPWGCWGQLPLRRGSCRRSHCWRPRRRPARRPHS